MLDHRISNALRTLKLAGMADEYHRQQITPTSTVLPMPERLMQMIHAENDARADRRCARLLNASGLTTTFIPENLIFSPDRSLDRSIITELLTCNWIRQAHNVTIVGATGSGKTFLGSALGRTAIRQSLAVRYYRTHRLAEDLAIARIDGSLRKLRQSLRKLALLILDEFGLFDIGEQGKEDILDILEDRAGTGSTIVIGQLSIKEWHEFIGTPLLADAILDRILCRSYNIELAGKSLRERNPSQSEV